jgi:hypothetical protein
MRKISSDQTYFFRFIWPWVGLLALAGIIIAIIHAGVYLVLFIVLPVWLFKLISSRFFYAQRHAVKLFVDTENQLFGVNDFKISYTLGFDELRQVKAMQWKKIIRLDFRSKILYFMPPGELNLLITNKELIVFLEDIVKTNLIKKGPPLSR